MTIHGDDGYVQLTAHYGRVSDETLLLATQPPFTWKPDNLSGWLPNDTLLAATTIHGEAGQHVRVTACDERLPKKTALPAMQ